MKAFLLLSACLLAAAPAQAFSRGGHPVFNHGGAHEGGRHRGHGFLSQTIIPGIYAPQVDAAPPAPAAELAPAPQLVLQAAPRCPAAAPPSPPAGPHIIYIGHRPEIHGPKVIYGNP